MFLYEGPGGVGDPKSLVIKMNDYLSLHNKDISTKISFLT